MTGSLRLSVRNLGDAEPHPARNTQHDGFVGARLVITRPPTMDTCARQCANKLRAPDMPPRI
jgi:hypothetical protein